MNVQTVILAELGVRAIPYTSGRAHPYVIPTESAASAAGWRDMLLLRTIPSRAARLSRCGLGRGFDLCEWIPESYPGSSSWALTAIRPGTTHLFGGIAPDRKSTRLNSS